MCWRSTDCPALVMVPVAVQVPTAVAGPCQGARWRALLTGRQLTSASSSDVSVTMMREVAARLLTEVAVGERVEEVPACRSCWLRR